MSTRKEKILELVKQRPCILAVQIADRVDCDIDEVNAALVELVASGQLVTSKVDAPNGIKANGYSVNSAFLGWKPAEKGAEEARESKVDKAIAFLKLNDGRASSEQLKKAMELDDKYSPSQYLGPALRSGKIARDGDDWVLGDAAASQAGKRMPAKRLTGGKEVEAAKPAKTARPTKPAHIPTDAVLSSLSIGELRIILWKKGNLVISANNNTVDLQPAQVRALTAFVELH